MINRGVWRKIDKMKIPENRRLIGNKWVFKIKRDGTYRARLVALGYSQIPGVDFTDNFAPVAHDVSFRIALARMMVEKLDSLVMDVETAFLYGDIEGEKLDENKHFESALMCWESLDESEPISKKRKTLSQEEATNDQADEIDDDPHNQQTANKGIGSLIPANDLQLGADDDASTLATQETYAKNLVYVTNIPDGKLDNTKNA